MVSTSPSDRNPLICLVILMQLLDLPEHPQYLQENAKLAWLYQNNQLHIEYISGDLALMQSYPRGYYLTSSIDGENDRISLRAITYSLPAIRLGKVKRGNYESNASP